MKARNLGKSLLALFAFAILSCAQTPTTVTVRSLELSGAVSFVCLGPPLNPDAGPHVGVGLPIERCTNQTAIITVDDYSVPHLIGLVTQTTRGEVAAVDVTAGTVLDSDPSTPGFNFLPVGTTPVGIASTPGGEATFVGVAQPGREGIFAIPSRLIPRGRNPDEGSVQSVPSLATWPACRLPVAPGAMTVVVSPPSANLPSGTAGCDGMPAPVDNDVAADLAAEGGGRMLVVALPELGEVDVIDTMSIMARPPGGYEACDVVARIPLSVDRANSGPLAPGRGLAACTPAKAGVVTSGGVPLAQPAAAHPSSLASSSDDSRIFVADDQAPVIHVLDGATPCALREVAPLLPSSAQEPDRLVVTSNVAVSPLTSAGKPCPSSAPCNRFVYAVDRMGGGTVMVFDVSAQSTQRTPMHLTNAWVDPYTLTDRIQVGAPARAVTFAKRDPPNTLILTALDGGPQPSGLVCDPSLAPNSGPPESYFQTASDFSYGAGPHTMRGVFALLTLDDGEIAVVDIEDYDNACRTPVDFSSMTSDPLLGCTGDPWSMRNTKNEVSCNVVEPHHVRSARYFLNDSVAGDFAPSMQSTPVLKDFGGSELGFDQAHAKLLGPTDLARAPYASISGNVVPIVAAEGGAPDASDDAQVDAGGEGGAAVASVDASMASGTSSSATGATVISSDPTTSSVNWVAFDLTEPRAHASQNWVVTYEGTVANFSRHVGQLQCRTKGTPPNQCTAGFDLVDSSIFFCDRGVHGADVAPKPELGDIVQITDDFPDPSTDYWSTPDLGCSYNQCVVTFGRADSLSTANPARDVVIEKAFQDHLQLAATPVMDATKQDGSTLPITCCFPSAPTYTVRAKGHWIVFGSAVGVVHHVIADASDSNHCIDSCDPARAILNSRVYELDPGAPVPSSDEPDPTRLFRNPQMRFAIWKAPSPDTPTARDTNFSFTETGGFGRLSQNLAAATSAVAPQDAVFLPSLGVLAVVDGASLGLVLVDPSGLTALRNFY